MRYLLKYRNERVLYPPNLLTTSIYHIVDWLIELVITPLEIYVSKDRANGSGLINLWQVSRCMLI